MCSITSFSQSQGQATPINELGGTTHVHNMFLWITRVQPHFVLVNIGAICRITSLKDYLRSQLFKKKENINIQVVLDGSYNLLDM